MKTLRQAIHESYMEWLYPSSLVIANREEIEKANGEYVKRRLDYEAHQVGFEAGMKYQLELQKSGVRNEG